MYNVSIVILDIEDVNNIFCLESIFNQSLKNIEIIGVCNNKITIFEKNNEIHFYHSIGEALNNINGHYVLFVRNNDYLYYQTCELLFNESKLYNLDLLFVPIVDENQYISISEKYSIFGEDIKFSNVSHVISQFNFAQFFRKELVSDFNFDGSENLFYQIYFNSKNMMFFNKNVYYRKNLSPEEVICYIKDILDNVENMENYVFFILKYYLEIYPLDLKNLFYNLIKTKFSINHLNDENQVIYNLILKNEYFIDFLAEYKLINLEYEEYVGLNSIGGNCYKITIIIPIFNNETLIHRTLMSIENQSIGLENIEVLMIDDASTDNTSKVINEYADKYPNFKAIHIKKGTGSPGTPRNLGLKLASADYVIFIDHDDFFEIDSLEKLYYVIEENNCDFVYGTYALIDLDKPIKFVYPGEKQGLFKNLEDNKRSIITPPSIWTKLFKKEFLLKNNILFPTILGEDAIFVSKALMEANGVYYLGEDIICYYNLNENSFTSNLSYDYFVEGFISEEYLFDLFSSWNRKDYYEIRGPGILDYYLNRFMYSNLNEYEIKKIFPLLYEFCNRLYLLKIYPKQDKNKILFGVVVKKDFEALIKIKHYKPSKFKRISNKILSKINKHGFW